MAILIIWQYRSGMAIEWSTMVTYVTRNQQWLPSSDPLECSWTGRLRAMPAARSAGGCGGGHAGAGCQRAAPCTLAEEQPLWGSATTDWAPHHHARCQPHSSNPSWPWTILPHLYSKKIMKANTTELQERVTKMRKSLLLQLLLSLEPHQY